MAGLIFLTMFLAAPTLGRSQRYTARKNDVRNLLAAIIQFKTNSGGKVPFNENNDVWIKLKPYLNKSQYLNDRPNGHIDDFGSFNSTTTQIATYSRLDNDWHRPGSWNIALGTVCEKSDGDGYCLKYGESVPTKDITILVSIALEYSY